MNTKATDLFKDQLIGEEIYFGKPEDRPIPQVGDECWVRQGDGELHEHIVTHVTKKQFCTERKDGQLACLGIPHKRFRKKG